MSLPASHASARLGAGPRTALSVAIALVLPLMARGGDILRGGAPAGKRAGGASSASPNAAVVDAARTNARDTLARTTQAVQAMQALQKSARDLARRNGNSGAGNPSFPGVALPRVPNGLGAGGLQVAPGVTANSPLWTGAKLPTQTVKNGKSEVVIKQEQQQAVLNWETFNIGQQTELTFDQSKGGKAASQWVAVNKVTDPSGAPSQILGSIKAAGQVYVLNQNGILFGGTSQVNTHALVASSLPINETLLSQGFLNNPDAQFLFSSLEIPALANNATMPAFTPPAAPNTPDGKPGDVVVQKGAQLSAPTSPAKVGGRIALVGPNVRNEGTISTPDGQTILAAGLQVGFTAHATSDPSLRGLDVFIGKVRATAADPLDAGTATNAGLIDAPRANVTIAGRAVEQLGVIESTTSVSLNGRIDLLASYNTTSPVVLGTARFSPGATGSVTLGVNSSTSILPEILSEETLASSKLPIGSQVNVQGRTIHLASGATLLAPSADVTMQAGQWMPFNGATKLVSAGGQIYFDAGARVDVAGTPDAIAAITQNILSLELRGAELADSPTQREGLLRGLTLNVDIRKTGVFNGLNWAGTPLGDATGFLNLIERTAAQLTTVGGKVKLISGGSVVLQPGALIDVSGGWTNYEGGFVETTRVVSGGRVYDISSATPDLVYTGLYRAESTALHPKWGISETFAQPLGLTGRHWENGYTDGANAGSVTITAPSMALDGTLRGQTVSGPRQRETGPAPGTLALSFSAEDPMHPAYLAYSPSPPTITFSEQSSLSAVAAFSTTAEGEPLALAAARRENVTLSPTLLSDAGFGVLKIENPDGRISLPAGVALNAPAGGSITLTAANLDIAGVITAPGGEISLTAYNISPAAFARLKAQTTPVPVTPAPNFGRGALTLASTATLSTAGLVLDERPGATGSLDAPIVLDGGSISLAGYDVNLARGSVLDVSGGARLDSEGELNFGAGGSISVKGGQDPDLTSVLGGSLRFASTLRGFSGGLHGGALEVQAPLVQIGGSPLSAQALMLSPEFFSTGGFTSFTIAGLGVAGSTADTFLPAVNIAPGTMIAPVAQSWLAFPHQPGQGGLALVPFTKPETERPSVSLAFEGRGAIDAFSNTHILRGEVLLGEGATIQTGPLASVALTGDAVSVLGSIYAPAGSIAIEGAKNSANIYADQSQALSTVFIGSQAVLSAAGTTLLSSNPFGHRTGSVLPGGSIEITGNIAARAGSLLDVSGATDQLDFAPAYLTTLSADPNAPSPAVLAASRGLTTAPFGQTVATQRIDSDAGSITLTGGQALQTDATLRGVSGGEMAYGGTLTISSGRFTPPSGTAPTVLDPTLLVKQSGFSALGVQGLGAGLGSLGQFSANQFAAGGFDSLALRGTVQFTGDVTIDARRELSIADAGVLYADGRVQLSAAYAKLGTPFINPVTPDKALPPFTQGGVAFNFQPTTGAGELIVTARNVDAGNLSLQNIGKATIAADGGDLRGNGTLDIAGDLTLRAAQIYPPSALSFTISASERNVAVISSAVGSKSVKLASSVLPPGFGVGSPLLGSTVASIDGDLVTLAANASTSISARTIVTYAPGSGSISIAASGTAALPMSAGGQLNLYAASIRQAGTLVAPFGQINLGWDGTGTAPKGAITGRSVSTTKTLTLAGGSLTSVGGLNRDGTPLLVPYGVNLNDISWIDPRGVDITGSGGPQKTINLAGAKIDSQRGAVVDIQGGGDLYAFRWVKGLGGSRDLTATETSFAVIPGYSSELTPYAPFNPAGTNLGGDVGYVNGALHAGDRIFLGASEGLAAGVYTLLPARYALLPGAFLVTPKAGAPLGTFALADGSTFVSGYRYSGLSAGQAADALNLRFEVLDSDVLRQRAEYEDYFANDFLREGALRLDAKLARLPGDAGHLVLRATEAMNLAGSVLAQAGGVFRAGAVDISSSGQIVIGKSASAPAGALVLNAAQLSSFGAESLLIGGIRTFTGDGATVSVQTTGISVDNRGTPLRAPEIILTAKENITLAKGASIQQSGSLKAAADTLFIGTDAVAGSGDGVLVRVSSDPSAEVIRAGLTSLTTPNLVLGAGATVAGASVTLDSTARTGVDPTARILGSTVSLRSGQISVQLEHPGALQPTTGLVLGPDLLRGLSGADRLSLLSYSSIDLYGTGPLNIGGALELHAGAIRGFNTAGGTAEIHASSILLDNSAAAGASAAGAASGTLKLSADRITIGSGQSAVSQYANVSLDAVSGLRLRRSGGLSVAQNLSITAPFLTASKAATQSITAGGALVLTAPAGTPSAITGAGLGANVTLQGASVDVGSRIVLPSGQLTLRATSGELKVRGVLDVSGTRQTFYDLTRYTGAGSITLQADGGAVNLAASSTLNLSSAGQGNGGALKIAAPTGTVTLGGELHARGGGSFALDVGSLASFDALTPVLADANFTRSQTFRVRTGDLLIGATNKAQSFNLSTDQGSITVSGEIDASGRRGGSISLSAGGGLEIQSGAKLTVAAQEFDAAGKGGDISLATRGLNGGQLDLAAGSTIDLSVAATPTLGQFTGTLHLRAPQTAAGTDLQLGAFGANILDASKVVVEGYKIYDLTGTPQITTAVQNQVFANGQTFASGLTSARLLAQNAELASTLVVTPGAEIINSTGNLQLGASNQGYFADWNLGTFRFGPKNVAGVLTLRAAGNLVFFNSLSDGFTTSAYTSGLLAHNGLLPANAQSWSYNLTAGADLAAADVTRVVPLSSLAANTGSLLLGKNAGPASAATPGLPAQTSAVVGLRFQTIRTGSGDITISTGRDVQLLNQFSTIYTAGTQVADPTLGGTFDTPNLIQNPNAATGVLGAPQQNPGYPVQFAYAGGNVTIAAQGDIAHYTRDILGQIIPDSSRELPMNWLYRRGYLDQATGQFGMAGGQGRAGEIASTAWWIDYSNFFEGVGALGGGNVTLTAGRDVANVDAVIPTNARLPKGTPDASKLVELGGGDLSVIAGRNIDAGVYYVERGRGMLDASGSITTNATRSPSLTNLDNDAAPLAPQTWLPTTLFVGKSSFDVSARGDLLLGPAANPFLLSSGFNNTVWYKTFFSTFAPASAVNVSSLAGSITLRQGDSPAGNSAQPILLTWLQDVLSVKSTSASFYQPWLRLSESSVSPFSSVAALNPGTLRATAFSGDINVVGGFTLSPSPTGTIELAARGSLNGLNRNGAVITAGSTFATWGTSTINLSDANPALIPSLATPFSYQAIVGTLPGVVSETDANFLDSVNALFAETGATRGAGITLSSKQALHAPGLLHAEDAEPVRLFAGSGSISGFTLYAGKAAQVIAGRDVSDIAFYLQNVKESDVTFIAAGRDIAAYNANTPLRVASQAAGNIINIGDLALAGDIQLGGPGTLEVFAGRNLDLGIGPSSNDGTGIGIATIGNARNSGLPFDGASLIAGAGLGVATSLTGPGFDFATFKTQILSDETLGKYLRELDFKDAPDSAAFAKLTPERQNQVGLQIFYRILRDAGRDASASGAATANYDAGLDAIDALLGKSSGTGDISLTARAIKTQSGGNISLVVPNGKVAVGFDVAGGQAVDQGILTEAGGDVSIFTKGNVDVGTSRIFTLRGGNIVIWSSEGDIAAGAAAKTVAAAPPTRVLIDPQSADVSTDLAGLATGGGIGVLATVAGIPPGDVDLIAPKGTIDAGDAGIRSAGNLTVAATQVLNAENIQVTGTSAGTPAPPSVPAPNLTALTAATTTAGGATQSALEAAKPQQPETPPPAEEAPSIVTVEVLGYGGGDF